MIITLAAVMPNVFVIVPVMIMIVIVIARLDHAPGRNQDQCDHHAALHNIFEEIHGLLR
jgi:hypothetical protein